MKSIANALYIYRNYEFVCMWLVCLFLIRVFPFFVVVRFLLWVSFGFVSFIWCAFVSWVLPFISSVPLPHFLPFVDLHSFSSFNFICHTSIFVYSSLLHSRAISFISFVSMYIHHCNATNNFTHNDYHVFSLIILLYHCELCFVVKWTSAYKAWTL